MKILWFSQTPIQNELSGDGNWVISLAEMLAEQFDIKLHIAVKANVKHIKKYKIGKIFIYNIPSVEFTKFKNKFLKYFNFEVDKNIIEKYKHVINIVNPDIIQLFGSEHNHGDILLSEIDIPIVIHIQCIYQSVYRKWFSGISESDLKKCSSFKAKVSRNTFYNQYKRHIRKFNKEKLYYNNCKYFIGRTEWDKRCTHFLSPYAQYFHCDEALRPEFFNKRWDKTFDDNIINIITTIGRSIYKGFETIIETMELLENNSSKKIVWRVIGLSDQDEVVKVFRNKYKNIYSSNIILLGRLKASQMIEYMKNSDIFVHPSHIENSSNAIAEAMLLGMPVIATFTGGTSSLIQNKINGFVIQDGDVMSLASAVIEMYNKPDEAKSLAIKAREVAIERHRPENIAKTLLNIYRKICY